MMSRRNDRPVSHCRLPVRGGGQTVSMRKSDRRERLLEAGTKLFASRGYAGTSVEAITASADVAKGSMYVHFASKEALILALMEKMVAILWSEIRAVVAIPGEAELWQLSGADRAAAPLRSGAGAAERGGGAARRVAKTLERIVACFEENPALARVLLLEAPVATLLTRKRHVSYRRLFIQAISANMQRLVERGRITGVSAAPAARFFFGSVHELVVSWLNEELDEPLAAATQQLVSYNLAALGFDPVYAD